MSRRTDPHLGGQIHVPSMPETSIHRTIRNKANRPTMRPQHYAFCGGGGVGSGGGRGSGISQDDSQLLNSSISAENEKVFPSYGRTYGRTYGQTLL